ncbi:MAG: iron ABC transporter substrate-binding protein [Jiangellaceae bacterium]|nr:iron ABC transporter substrate-binding protein [Jiangellaceae bacterium]
MAVRRFQAAALAVVTLAVSACGDGAAADVDQSDLVLYSGRSEDLVQPVIDDFEAQTGIEVSVRYGNTAQLAAQILEEGERSPADVYFSQDGGALGALTKRGMLAELPADVLDSVDARYRATDGTWVGTSGRSRVIVFDPAQVAEADVPDSVFELTDRQWKGKVGISPSNASFEAFVTAMRVLHGDQVAREWLEAMAENDVQLFDNNVLILNAAEDGVIALGLINHYYWYQQVAEEGIDAVPARLKFLPGGDPGALVNVAGVGVLASTDKRDAALRFVEHLLGEDAQTFFAQELKEYPLVQGVLIPPDLPPLESLQSPEIDLSDLDTLEATLKMIEDAGLT